MNNLFFLFIFVPLLALILLTLNLFFAPHKPDESKLSAYECGFIPVYGQTRSTFQINFYVIAMLFLIFDLEILLLFPIAVTLYQINVFGFSIGILFFTVLTIGFVLEIGSGTISLTNNKKDEDKKEINEIIENIKNTEKNSNIKLTPNTIKKFWEIK